MIKNLLKKAEVRIIGLEFILVIFCTLLSLIVGKFNYLPALILSATLLTILFFIAKWLTNNYVNDNNHRKLFIGTVITSIIGLVAYAIVVYNSELIEILKFNSDHFKSDHTIYFNSQKEMRDVFDLSPIKGLYSIVSSCWNSDYSYFINTILALPLMITNGSNDSFIIVYYLVLIVPVCYMYNLWVLNLSEKFCAEKINTVFVMCNIVFLTFPLLHFACILGMPDLFGLFFVFGIFTIMTNYEYDKFNLLKAVIASVLMFFLVITRRWYVFTLIGLFGSIILVKFVYSLLSNDKLMKKKVILGEIKFSLVAAIIILCTLSPFIYKTLFVRNYSEEYTYWNKGGLSYEIINQMGYLGILMLFLILFGFIYGLVNKKLRQITIISCLGFSATIYSFTTIQNMGKHQLLCLCIYYLLFIYNIFIFINKIKIKPLRFLLITLVIGVFMLNTFSTFSGYINQDEGVYIFTKYSISKRLVWG